MSAGGAFKAFEGSSTSVPSLVASAHGVVLEVGPGGGTQLDRFDKSKIDHVYGVELNPEFIKPLLSEVDAVGLEGKYTVIAGSVEDEALLAEYGLKAGTLDSVVCIGTLCSVSNPDQTMRWIYKLLKPGGVFIFWEHRRSHDVVTRLVQGMYTLGYTKYLMGKVIGVLTFSAFWNPLWRYVMGGCDLTRSLGDVIRDAGDWAVNDSNIDAQNSSAESSIMPRVEGRLIKRV
jgi:SAM-dependent methyltransferase